MLKPLIPLALLAAFIAASGSSCHDYDKDETAKPPPPQGNSRLIPPQQLNPPTMPRQRM
ncbi:hypothetical protein ACQKP5_16265 [Pseudomonas vancouverensis]|uniref:hypothetical protein n=1 Tax=Pseudomonas vancouverensis TaxID=95300 RepID=UPI003D0841B6